MNYLKNFFIKDTSNTNDLQGRFYELLKNNQWHCLFNKSICTIEKRNNRQALCIKHYFEDGDELDESETANKIFILGLGMKFKEETSTPCESLGFTFFGKSQEGNIMKFLYEVYDPDNIRQIDKYEDILSKLIVYNNENKIPVSSSSPKQNKNENIEEDDEDDILIELSDSEDSTIIELSDDSNDIIQDNINPIDNLKHKNYISINYKDCIKSINGNLYSYEDNNYINMGNITIKLCSITRYSFCICLTKNDNIFFHYPLDSKQHFAFTIQDYSIEWIGKIKNKVWAMKIILSPSDFESFQQSYVISNWEMKNKSNFKSLKEDDKTFIVKSTVKDKDNISLKDDSGDSFTFIEDSEDEEESEDEYTEDDDEDEEDEYDNKNIANNDDKNSKLAVGFVSDRAFVARGKKIGVFKITEDNQLEFNTTIENIQSPSSKALKPPSQMMLHQQDEKMLLLNEDNKHSIFCMDMNRGEIIEEWKTANIGYAVKQLIPENKLAQLENTSTFVGINSTGAFRIDPRVSSKEKQMNNYGFKYNRSTNPNFCCAATTESGDLLMGSTKGDIRLFNASQLTKENLSDQMKTKAKNQLRLAGDPVIGVDVTSKGDWILATCDCYLMLIPVKVNGVDGFERSLTGANRLPGKRLELSRAHILEMGGNINFTVAHFNRDFDGNERTIVTSTGPYVITWDFKKVIKGILDEYQIKQYRDKIVDEQFKFGEDKAIIVTLPDDVKIAKRALKKRK